MLLVAAVAHALKLCMFYLLASSAMLFWTHSRAMFLIISRSSGVGFAGILDGGTLSPFAMAGRAFIFSNHVFTFGNSSISIPPHSEILRQLMDIKVIFKCK